MNRGNLKANYCTLQVCLYAFWGKRKKKVWVSCRQLHSVFQTVVGYCGWVGVCLCVFADVRSNSRYYWNLLIHVWPWGKAQMSLWIRITLIYLSAFSSHILFVPVFTFSCWSPNVVSKCLSNIQSRVSVLHPSPTPPSFFRYEIRN